MCEGAVIASYGAEEKPFMRKIRRDAIEVYSVAPKVDLDRSLSSISEFLSCLGSFKLNANCEQAAVRPQLRACPNVSALR